MLHGFPHRSHFPSHPHIHFHVPRCPPPQRAGTSSVCVGCVGFCITIAYLHANRSTPSTLYVHCPSLTPQHPLTPITLCIGFAGMFLMIRVMTSSVQDMCRVTSTSLMGDHLLHEAHRPHVFRVMPSCLQDMCRVTSTSLMGVNYCMVNRALLYFGLCLISTRHV